MIDMNEATQKGPVARTRSVAIAGLWLAVGLGLLAGCAADRPLRTPDVGKAIRADLPPTTATRPVAVPSRISDALAEPAPPVVPMLPEPKLDLLVNNALAREVFLAIVTDTRYSMLMHPDVAGTLSVTLRGVTVLETLEAIRDVYGYDFKMEGRRITVYAPTLQTRIFTINYPHTQRVGVSDLRVSAGAMTGSQNDTSRVSTSSRTDLWSELTSAVCTMIGGAEGACPKSATVIGVAKDADTKQSTQTTTNTGSMGNAVIAGGRSVVTSPQAGIMAVRAMPDELRQVEKFLKTAQIAVERQVMLEAKIVTVELRDGYQSGIDWSALKNSGGVTGAIGSIGGGTTSATSDNVLVRGVLKNLPGFTAGTAVLANALPAAGGGLFGLTFATSGFQAILGFLETQGDVQILSSPRIATLNNQKALLKVGTDEYYVTGFTTVKDEGVAGAAPTFTTRPSISPMFSGIALDVMPQIDEANNITLYIRPSVTAIVEKEKKINLGLGSGTISIPLASRSVNESDTIVRLQDGNIVAIGGLMQIESSRQNSGLPGSSNIPFFSALLGNRSNSGRKIELVVLIKPTIIRNAQDWAEQTRRTHAALDDMDVARARVIRIDGTVEDAGSKSLVK